MSRSIFLFLVLVAVSFACSPKPTEIPCTDESKLAYYVAMLGYYQSTNTEFMKSHESHSDLTKQLANTLDRAREEPVPNCVGAKEYRSAVLELLDANYDVARRPFLIVGSEELLEQQEYILEVQLKLATAHDDFWDAPVPPD